MRWGIVGTGAIASRFIEALSKISGAKCVAVCSRDFDNASRFAERHGIAQTARTSAELASLPEVDVVYIASPNHCHFRDSLAAIEAGTGVLCEKPLATNANDAKRIKEAANAAGVFAMEGLWSLCLPVYQTALKKVNNGAIGEPMNVSASFGVPQSSETMPRLFDPESGGALLDRGVYLISLARAFLGDISLSHAEGNVTPDGLDLDTTLFLTSQSNRTAVLSASINRLAANTFTVSGSHGRMIFSEPVSAPFRVRLDKADPKRAFAGAAAKPGIAQRAKSVLRQSAALRRMRDALAGETFKSGLEWEIEEVENCMRQGLHESLVVPLSSSIQTLEIIDRAKNLLFSQGGAEAP